MNFHYDLWMDVLIPLFGFVGICLIVLLISNSLSSIIKNNTQGLVTIGEMRSNAESRVKKRTFDIVVSLCVIIFIFPWFIPIIGLLIIIESKGPVFFKIKKYDLSGKLYKTLKFRTVKMPLNYKKGIIDFQLNEDVQPTKIGKFLLKTGLNEIPNFMQVFKGELSVVGLTQSENLARPISKLNVGQLSLLHKYKPGIISLFNVSKDNYLGNSQNILDYDLYYARHYSLWLDLKILLYNLILIISDFTIYQEMPFIKTTASINKEELINDEISTI